LEKALNARGLITILPGGLITKLQKHPRIKSEILFKIAKRRRFAQHCSLSSSEDVTWQLAEKRLQQRRRRSRGHVPRLISLRPLLRPCKGKLLHPVAIKARGCTAPGGEERQKKKRERRGDSEENNRRETA